VYCCYRHPVSVNVWSTERTKRGLYGQLTFSSNGYILYPNHYQLGCRKTELVFYNPQGYPTYNEGPTHGVSKRM
jgi:hypothetical protein